MDDLDSQNGDITPFNQVAHTLICMHAARLKCVKSIALYTENYLKEIINCCKLQILIIDFRIIIINLL